MEACSTPAMGLLAALTARSTSSNLVTSPDTSVVSHWSSASSFLNGAASADVPADLERKTRCLAPRSTNHVAMARPSPPKPPTNKYAASLLSCSGWALAADWICSSSSAPSNGISITILPMCCALCMNRKASVTAAAGYVFTGVMGVTQPLSYMSTICCSSLCTASGRLAQNMAKSKHVNVLVRPNGSMSSMPWRTMSPRPISTMVPNSATQAHDA